MTEQIIIAGFGGQGVMSMGQMVAYAGFPVVINAVLTAQGVFQARGISLPLPATSADCSSARCPPC